MVVKKLTVVSKNPAARLLHPILLMSILPHGYEQLSDAFLKSRKVKVEELMGEEEACFNFIIPDCLL
jgi:hypothetical protein